jgi:hypothetical protein
MLRLIGETRGRTNDRQQLHAAKRLLNLLVVTQEELIVLSQEGVRLQK